MIGVQDMMRNIVRLCMITIFVMVLAGLFSCSEEPPPAPQTQVVKKKIGGQQQVLTAKPPAPAEKPAPQMESQAKDSGSAKDKPVAEPTQEKEVKEASKLVEESKAIAGGYNATGRFDPFEPLFKSEPEEKSVTTGKRREPRIKKTPLEYVALSQLKLSAIMRTAKGNSAIVEDATGKGYVIRKGTYIGLNSGQVVQINKDRVRIEEEIEDLSGEFRINSTELKLQKPAGEL